MCYRFSSHRAEGPRNGAGGVWGVRKLPHSAWEKWGLSSYPDSRCMTSTITCYAGKLVVSAEICDFFLISGTIQDPSLRFPSQEMSPSLVSSVPSAALGLVFNFFLFLTTLSPYRSTSKSFLLPKYFSHLLPPLYLHCDHQFREGLWSWMYKAGHGLSPKSSMWGLGLIGSPQIGQGLKNSSKL